MSGWFGGDIGRYSGFLGRLVLRDRTFNQMIDWGLDHASYGEHYIILDVGCGSGEAIRNLAARAPYGKVYGVDTNSDSVITACNYNNGLISSGHSEILKSDVLTLPFPDENFDVVTAVETHYYWPDLVENMKEIYRVLVPYGKFLIIGGEYLGSSFDERNQKWAEDKGINLHTLLELKEKLEKAGFTEVEIHEEREKGWFCTFARRPWK